MAAVCQYNKFGHCKFQRLCRNHHIDVICNDSNCDVINCNNRHPMKCKYYQNFQRCKFSQCSYKHEEWKKVTNGADEAMKILENSIEKKVSEIEEIKDTLLKLVATVEDIQKVSNENEAKIKSMNDKRSTTIHTNQIDERLKEIEANNYILMNAVDDVEKDVKMIQISMRGRIPGHRCEICGTVYQNNQSLRTHLITDHGIH